MFSISSILSPLGALILSIELLISSSLWKIAIDDGLKSTYDFDFWKTFNINIQAFHSDLFAMIPYLLFFSAIYSSFYLISSKNGKAQEILLKFSESILFFALSIVLINSFSTGTMEVSKLILSQSTKWSYYFSISYMIGNICSFFSSKSSVLEIVFDGIYLTSAMSMLSFLMLRLAILITLYIFLPFLSLLTGINALRKFIIKLWLLYIQLLVSPIIILILIYFYLNFSGYFFIQLGFLSLLSILPYSFIYTSYRLNQSNSGMFSNFFLLSGYGFLSSTLEKGVRLEKQRHEDRARNMKSQNPELNLPQFFRLNDRDEGYDG
ncbi:MAG: hypothetical protein B2I18_03010 [Cuniculiplasma sp. C_DKE]|nr:MAG: hypothetical protein B2I18_03010 [Cuniculiplasma sp. C_DKE]